MGITEVPIRDPPFVGGKPDRLSIFLKCLMCSSPMTFISMKSLLLPKATSAFSQTSANVNGDFRHIYDELATLSQGLVELVVDVEIISVRRGQSRRLARSWSPVALLVGAARLDLARSRRHILPGHACLPIPPLSEIAYTVLGAERRPGIRAREEHWRHCYLKAFPNVSG